MESGGVIAEAIEASEFPDLARQYRVMAVPRTVINDTAVIEGAMPEAMFVEQVLAAASGVQEKGQ
jgi:predicted DsbA family dithiol-disulfide isomerase